MKKMLSILLALTVLTAVTFVATNPSEGAITAKVLPGSGGGGGD